MVSLDSKLTVGVETYVQPSVDRFYMVYGIGRGGPTYRHPTKESAHKEAQRLAEANPGSSFVVLKATKAYHAGKPVARQVELSDPDFREVEGRPYF
jgi:hypothetical protein